MTETPTRSDQLDPSASTRAEQRRLRATSADERLRSLWDQAVTSLELPATGAALVAVGGYGRKELSPHSDLDVVLLCSGSYDEDRLTALADKLWYPLWDANVPLDYSVRSDSELRAAAADDLRVALGLIDMRHVAGDPALTLSTRSTVLADWRRAAKHRLPLLAEYSRERWERVGDLAHATTPDLKDAHGGLRDVMMMRALLASWLVDVPSAELQRLSCDLLEIRDALHETTGRHSDRLVADYAPEVAQRCGLPDTEALRSWLVTTGRGLAHLASVALRNIDWLLTPASRVAPRRPRLDLLAPGVGAYRGEVVLTEKASPWRDPLLGLRAAEAAASRDLVLTDSAAARLRDELAPMPVPWPAEGRALFTRLLGSGSSLLDVWESLDQYGVVQALIPEWKRVRYLAPQSPVHRFTVDRHLVQTCVEASQLLDRVDRPDILVVAALLHDIGKGEARDHSEAGSQLVVGIARRIGFLEADVARISRLVAHHLTLITAATTDDIDDPATIRGVADAVGDVSTLGLLTVLTEADALATGPQAWTPWRKQLLSALVERVQRHLDLN